MPSINATTLLHYPSEPNVLTVTASSVGSTALLCVPALAGITLAETMETLMANNAIMHNIFFVIFKFLVLFFR